MTAPRRSEFHSPRGGTRQRCSTTGGWTCHWLHRRAAASEGQPTGGILVLINSTELRGTTPVGGAVGVLGGAWRLPARTP